jgi:transposase
VSCRAGSRRKTDVIDAAAAASVAALQGDATPVSSEDHTTVFALLEERCRRRFVR